MEEEEEGTAKGSNKQKEEGSREKGEGAGYVEMPSERKKGGVNAGA